MACDIRWTRQQQQQQKAQEALGPPRGGRRVIVRWSMRGIHGGTFVGVAPTGHEAAIAGITIDRMADAKIAEAWSSYDQLGMLQQLGFLLQSDHGEGDYEDLGPDSAPGMIM